MRTALLLLLIFFSRAWSLAAPKEAKISGTTPLFSISGNADLTSHFVHRGLSYSDNNPALNAEFLLHMGSQFKLGIWGSNISNVNNPDDNFWFKFVGEIRVDLNAMNQLDFFVYDNRFYKAEGRNGQNMGFRLNVLKKFYGEADFGTNFEGSQTSYEYFSFGYIHAFNPVLKAKGQVGYTHQRMQGIYDYLDFRAEGLYEPYKHFSFYLGTSFPSQMGQFNDRSKSFIFGGVRFDY